MPEVVRTLVIPAEPRAVWRWFAHRDALRRWWGTPDLEIDLAVGGAFSMTGQDGRTRVSGTVLELVPQRRLVLSWHEEDAGWIHPARLLLTLEPVGDGTSVTLCHDGFAGIGSTHWQDVATSYDRGADAHALLPRLAELVLDDVA